MAKLDRRSR